MTIGKQYNLVYPQTIKPERAHRIVIVENFNSINTFSPEITISAQSCKKNTRLPIFYCDDIQLNTIRAMVRMWCKNISIKSGLLAVMFVRIKLYVYVTVLPSPNKQQYLNSVIYLGSSTNGQPLYKLAKLPVPPSIGGKKSDFLKMVYPIAVVIMTYKHQKTLAEALLTFRIRMFSSS